MFSVTRIGLSIVLLGALCGVASMPAVAQPDGLNNREQTIAELREQARRSPADAEIAGQLAQQLVSLLGARCDW